MHIAQTRLSIDTAPREYGCDASSTTNTDSLMGICARHDSTALDGNGNSLILLHSDNVRVSNCYIYDAQIAVGCNKDGGSAGANSDRLAAQFRNWTVENCVLDTCGNKIVEFEDVNIDTLENCISKRLGFSAAKKIVRIEANCDELKRLGACHKKAK